VRTSIKDEIRAGFFRGNFPHALTSAAQSLNWLNPANIGVAMAAMEDIVRWGERGTHLCSSIFMQQFILALLETRHVNFLASL
jgi:hypothetical protein